MMGLDLNDGELEPVRFGPAIDKIFLWNLSNQPKPTDPIPMSLTWLHLADILHTDETD